MQLRYNYHLAGKGWGTCGKNESYFRKGHKSYYKPVEIIVCQWIYSWMKSGYLAESEYIESKDSFQKYLIS